MTYTGLTGHHTKGKATGVRPKHTELTECRIKNSHFKSFLGRGKSIILKLNLEVVLPFHQKGKI